MNKQAPTTGRLLLMAGFALSCFGLLLFLWVSFGGPTPLAAKGYRVSVRIPEATQLAKQADVRISGVSVGKVVSLTRNGHRTRAVLQIDPQFAPLSAATRVIQRQKTLLGETYLELTVGPRRGPSLPDGGVIPDRNVASTVELDEVLRALNPTSRRNLQRWVRGWAGALDGRARDINDSLGTLATLMDDGGADLEVLAANRRALQRLVADSATVFSTIGRRDADVRQLITSADQIFEATSRRRRSLEQIVGRLPAFLSALRATTTPATQIDAQLTPALRELQPAARRLPQEIPAAGRLAAELTATAAKLRPVLRAAATGLPAVDRIISALAPAVDRLSPLAADVVPASRFLDAYKRDFTRSWAFVAAATQATLKTAGGRDAHYLRLVLPITTELLGVYPDRQPFNRANPYPSPGERSSFTTTPLSFGCAHLKNGSFVPALGTPPPCKQQLAFSLAGEPPAAYPQLRPWQPVRGRNDR